MKVLIADDSLMVCERLTTMLKHVEGIEIVGEAHNVSDTIHSIKNMKPEVVILDIQMPGGSGIDVVQKVKKDTAVPIIIMLTNHSGPFYSKKYIAAGADFFFDKSMEFEKIRDVVHQMNENTYQFVTQ
jgi:DNA-binding NarL/FixJ family response regulator